MPNYRKRFTRKEFQEEYATHLRDVPPGLLRSKKRLEAAAGIKAGYYEEALAALDEAVARIKQIAVTHPDKIVQEDADVAIKQITAAIDTYGEASMAQNNSWDGGD
ncbi:MAG TPA: hypothetical protein VF275_11660 [Gammaproteobacteria bacterium]